jgi:hypothetical protein
MEQLKNVYLGKFYIEYLFEDEDYKNDGLPVLINEDDETDYYELDSFMRESTIIEGIGEIHGVMGLTNTCSIVLKLNDSCEGAELWKVY